MNDEELELLSLHIDKHSDIQYICNNIAQLPNNEKKNIEQLLKLRIFEYQIFLGRLK